jgi:hypothetical protein
MREFATERYPLRASSLPALAQCGLSLVMRAEVPGDSGEAADTGSLIHVGIKGYHKSGESPGVGMAVMAAHAREFPRANSAKARRHFEAYCEKQKDAWGKVILCEEPIKLRLPPAESDPTQEEIVISGTLDQVRDCGPVSADGRC